MKKFLLVEHIGKFPICFKEISESNIRVGKKIMTRMEDTDNGV